jgi:hypothetical protein
VSAAANYGDMRLCHQMHSPTIRRPKYAARMAARRRLPGGLNGKAGKPDAILHAKPVVTVEGVVRGDHGVW